jgi:hypothetical protein
MCTEVNWPVLKSYLEEDKVAFEDLELPCGVCHDTMTVLWDCTKETFFSRRPS